MSNSNSDYFEIDFVKFIDYISYYEQEFVKNCLVIKGC